MIGPHTGENTMFSIRRMHLVIACCLASLSCSAAQWASDAKTRIDVRNDKEQIKTEIDPAGYTRAGEDIAVIKPLPAQQHKYIQKYEIRTKRYKANIHGALSGAVLCGMIYSSEKYPLALIGTILFGIETIREIVLDGATISADTVDHGIEVVTEELPSKVHWPGKPCYVQHEQDCWKIGTFDKNNEIHVRAADLTRVLGCSDDPEFVKECLTFGRFDTLCVDVDGKPPKIQQLCPTTPKSKKNPKRLSQKSPPKKESGNEQQHQSPDVPHDVARPVRDPDPHPRRSASGAIRRGPSGGWTCCVHRRHVHRDGSDHRRPAGL
jgi:hypothetical protein